MLSPCRPTARSVLLKRVGLALAIDLAIDQFSKEIKLEKTR